MKHQEELRRAIEDLRKLKGFSEYQKKAYDGLREESTHLKTSYTSLVDHVENHGIFQDLKKWGMRWKNSSKLASLANKVIKDIPKNIKKVDAAMHQLNTSQKFTNLSNFVKIC